MMWYRLTRKQCENELLGGDPLPENLEDAKALVKVHRIEQIVRSKSYKDTLDWYNMCSQEDLKQYATWKKWNVEEIPIIDLFINRWCEATNGDTVLPIGQYKGQTYETIRTSDPEYCDWASKTYMTASCSDDLGRFGHWLLNQAAIGTKEAGSEVKMRRLQQQYDELAKAYQELAGSPWIIVEE